MNFRDSVEVFYTNFVRYKRVIYKLPIPSDHTVTKVSLNHLNELIIYSRPIDSQPSSKKPLTIPIELKSYRLAYLFRVILTPLKSIVIDCSCSITELTGTGLVTTGAGAVTLAK
jgi:hypothetical protein